MGKHRRTEDTRSRAGRRGPARAPALIAVAAAGCLLTAAAGTYSAVSKDVALVVDGRTEQVGSTMGTVGTDPAPTDAAPAVAGLSDGTTLPPVSLSSVPLPPGASAPLPTVVLVVAGQITASGPTPAVTVADLLAAGQITLGPLDRVGPAPSTPLTDGLQVTVQRGLVVASTQVELVVAPADIHVTDADLDRGTSKRVRVGRAGSVRVTRHTTMRDGLPVARLQTGRTVLLAPQAGLVQVGTRTPDPAGPTAAAAAAARFTRHGMQVLTHDTTFGVNWDGLSMCESTHNPRAINANPSAGLPTYGLFQFDLPTWSDVGGTGNPIDATPQEQLMRAKMLWQRRGLEPWACRDAAH